MILAALGAGFLHLSQISKIQGSLREAGFRQALEFERLADLSSLTGLRVLRLCGQAVPLEVLQDLGTLRCLQSLSVNAGSDVPMSVPLASAAASSSSSGSTSGTVLGAALQQLSGLTHLSLSGLRNIPSTCLRHLSLLPSLTHLELVDSADLRVSTAVHARQYSLI
jgi:hypothetical protein